MILLIHLPLVPHICVSESGQHWFRQWPFDYSASSHYLNQCRVIVNWTHVNKLQWNFNQNTIFFIQETAFENVVCEMAAILSRGGDDELQGVYPLHNYADDNTICCSHSVMNIIKMNLENSANLAFNRLKKQSYEGKSVQVSSYTIQVL